MFGDHFIVGDGRGGERPACGAVERVSPSPNRRGGVLQPARGTRNPSRVFCGRCLRTQAYRDAVRVLATR